MSSSHRFLMSVFALGCLVSTPALSASAPDLNLATTFISLALVIALILGLAWFLRRMRLPGLGGAHSTMKVVSQLPLGQKERLMILKVNDEHLLVGVTPQQISLLKTLDMPSAEEESSSNFSSQLSHMLKKHENN